MALQQQRQFCLLLVDDDPSMLSSLKRIFHNAPYDIHTAQRGYDALEILEKKHIDAVLMDLKMPGMDGMALFEVIRRQWPAIRIIILTGYGGVKKAVAAIQMGAVDFLQKPWENENLIARVGQLYQIWQLEMQVARGFDTIEQPTSFTGERLL
jgi:DNA-binding NtrC family response regulator